MAAGLLAAVAMLLSGKHSDSQDGTGGKVDLFLSIALVVTSCLVFLMVGIATREVPLSREPTTKLGSPGYDLTPVDSPSASGIVLKVLSMIVSNKVFGHLIARNLLNENGPDLLRDLARQAADQRIPVVSMPLCRIDNKTVTDAMAKTAADAEAPPQQQPFGAWHAAVSG